MKKISERENIKLIIEVNDNNFQEKVVEQSKTIPIVVDFWAQWCMPCLILGPVLEKLIKEYDRKFILAKLNVDEGRIISQKYEVMAIPSVKLFKNGKIIDQFIGALPESEVKKWLNKNLR